MDLWSTLAPPWDTVTCDPYAVQSTMAPPWDKGCSTAEPMEQISCAVLWTLTVERLIQHWRAEKAAVHQHRPASHLYITTYSHTHHTRARISLMVIVHVKQTGWLTGPVNHLWTNHHVCHHSTVLRLLPSHPRPTPLFDPSDFITVPLLSQPVTLRSSNHLTITKLTWHSKSTCTQQITSSMSQYVKCTAQVTLWLAIAWSIGPANVVQWRLVMGKWQSRSRFQSQVLRDCSVYQVGWWVNAGTASVWQVLGLCCCNCELSHTNIEDMLSSSTDSDTDRQLASLLCCTNHSSCLCTCGKLGFDWDFEFWDWDLNFGILNWAIGFGIWE